MRIIGVLAALLLLIPIGATTPCVGDEATPPVIVQADQQITVLQLTATPVGPYTAAKDIALGNATALARTLQEIYGKQLVGFSTDNTVLVVTVRELEQAVRLELLSDCPDNTQYRVAGTELADATEVRLKTLMEAWTRDRHIGGFDEATTLRTINRYGDGKGLRYDVQLNLPARVSLRQ